MKNCKIFWSEIPSAYSEKIFRKSIDFRNRNSEFGMGQNLGIFGIRNSEFHPIPGTYDDHIACRILCRVCDFA